MITTAIFSLALLGTSGLLIDAHRRQWGAVLAAGNLTAGQMRYARAEYRRRMLASSTIGVVGGLIGVGPLVPRHPLWMTGYVALLLLATLAILLLALLDVWASRQRYHQLRANQLIAQARLRLELQRQNTEHADRHDLD